MNRLLKTMLVNKNIPLLSLRVQPSSNEILTKEAKFELELAWKAVALIAQIEGVSKLTQQSDTLNLAVVKKYFTGSK